MFSCDFDYVTVMLCLHEMDCHKRHKVITGCLEIANQVILVDYSSPFPGNILGVFQTLVELSAGKRHYSGFRDWQDRGGMEGFIKQERLVVKRRTSWQNGLGETVVVSGFK